MSLELHGLDTPERICFYEQDFYVFSNFSSFKVEVDGILFDTSEQAYHWFKFTNDSCIQADILSCRSAHDAFKLAGLYKDYRVSNWDEIKVEVMRKILIQKVKQNPYVMKKLLDSGNRELVENSWRDDVWGWGANKDGQNLLGKLWMEIRTHLTTALENQ